MAYNVFSFLERSGLMGQVHLSKGLEHKDCLVMCIKATLCSAVDMNVLREAGKFVPADVSPRFELDEYVGITKELAEVLLEIILQNNLTSHTEGVGYETPLEEGNLHMSLVVGNGLKSFDLRVYNTSEDCLSPQDSGIDMCLVVVNVMQELCNIGFKFEKEGVSC